MINKWVFQINHSFGVTCAAIQYARVEPSHYMDLMTIPCEVKCV